MPCSSTNRSHWPPSSSALRNSSQLVVIPVRLISHLLRPWRVCWRPRWIICQISSGNSRVSRRVSCLHEHIFFMQTLWKNCLIVLIRLMVVDGGFRLHQSLLVLESLELRSGSSCVEGFIVIPVTFASIYVRTTPTNQNAFHMKRPDCSCNQSAINTDLKREQSKFWYVARCRIHYTYS
jgi:hypothetical protein